MTNKKKMDEKVFIFKLNSFNGNIPELIVKPSIKKSKGIIKKQPPARFGKCQNGCCGVKVYY